MLQLVAMTAVAWQQWVTTERGLISFRNGSHIQPCPHFLTYTRTLRSVRLIANTQYRNSNSSGGSTLTVMSLLSWKPQAGIVLPSSLQQKTPRCFHLSFFASLSSSLSRSPTMAPLCFPMMKLTCREGK